MDDRYYAVSASQTFNAIIAMLAQSSDGMTMVRSDAMSHTWVVSMERGALYTVSTAPADGGCMVRIQSVGPSIPDDKQSTNRFFAALSNSLAVGLEPSEEAMPVQGPSKIVWNRRTVTIACVSVLVVAAIVVAAVLGVRHLQGSKYSPQSIAKACSVPLEKDGTLHFEYVTSVPSDKLDKGKCILDHLPKLGRNPEKNSLVTETSQGFTYTIKTTKETPLWIDGKYTDIYVRVIDVANEQEND